MFTYIKLHNFLSFKDVTFDFRKGTKKIKQLISIYGENGSGKSNFVSSIDLLRKSIDSFLTLGLSEKLYNVTESKDLPKNQLKTLPDDILRTILENTSIKKILYNSRMIDCDEITSAEYGFQIGDHEGYYIIKFSDKFEYEKLYYYTGKISGTIFEITDAGDNISARFSNKLFSNKKVKDECFDEIKKYWGKHTFLSILNKEKYEKNEQYIKENYLSYAFDLINMLQQITIHNKKSPRFGSEFSSSLPINVLNDLRKGRINKDNENILNRTERILNDFFTQAYADIKEVYYEKNFNDGHIDYRLNVKKMIGGQIRTIDFKRESAGTQHILDIFRVLLGAFCGVTVVYDEIDNGIHDLLLKSILESMSEYITGQLIMTTHNTYLLENADIKSVYLIKVDYLGNKEVLCLDEYSRIQGSNNPRNMYLKGLFGGIPIVDRIDYDEIYSEVNDDYQYQGSNNGGE